MANLDKQAKLQIAQCFNPNAEYESGAAVRLEHFNCVNVEFVVSEQGKLKPGIRVYITKRDTGTKNLYKDKLAAICNEIEGGFSVSPYEKTDEHGVIDVCKSDTSTLEKAYEDIVNPGNQLVVWKRLYETIVSGVRDLTKADTGDKGAMIKSSEGVSSIEKDVSSESDDHPRIIILRWNPYKTKDGEPIWTDSEKALRTIRDGRSYPENWRCHTKDVREGDTIYIYKSKGKEEAGIVAHGTVVSDRRVENGEGRIDIVIDSMVDYTCEEYITCSTIKTLTKDGGEAKEFSSYGKEYQNSGFSLPEVFDEKKISDAWNSLLAFKKIIAGESLNCIRFGAPGTGKSFEINEKYKNVWWASKERVTFHPDYSYANFVGAYKPYMKGEKEIAYAFVPGPFTRVLVNALRDPNGKHLLVIEEINRANTAAVFGDVFQLLDRGKNGESEYAISPSQDLAKFLRVALEKTKPSEESSGDGDKEDDWWWLTTEKPAMDQKKIRELIRNLKIPSNMYLWATMNSADQGVFPMDTAFKRRWSFEYVGIDQGCEDLEKRGELAKRWNELRQAINIKLVDLKVNEDKCMGPFFLAKDSFANVKVFKDVFKSKVLMYLFEDAARQKRSNVFADGLNTLSSIFNALNETKSVFKDGDLNKVLSGILELGKDDRDKSTTDGQTQAEDVASAQQESQGHA